MSLSFSSRFWPTNHVGTGFSSCCHVKPEISSSLSARGPSFAEQSGAQSQNFPHTWTELWVCNKAESRPSFSLALLPGFLHRSIIHCIIFFFLLKLNYWGKKGWGGGGRRECKRNKSVCLPAAGRCNTAAIGTTARASNYKQADSFKCRTLQGKKKKRKKKDRRQHERCLSWLVSTQSPPAFDSAQSPDSSLTLEPWQYRKAGGEGRQNTLY